MSEMEQILNTKSTHSYKMRGRPEYTFDKLDVIAKKLLSNLDEMLSGIMQMDMMKKSVKRTEE